VLASTGSGMYASSDGGVTFAERALAGLSLGTLTMHSDGLRGYACAAGLGAVRTNDGGATWSPVNRGLEGVHVQRLALTDTQLVAGTVNGPFVSSDFARSFRRVDGFLSMPVTDARQSGGTLWLGTFGVGLWALDRDATGWQRVPARDLDNEYAFSIFPREGATFARGPVLVGGYGALVQRLEGPAPSRPWSTTAAPRTTCSR